MKTYTGNITWCHGEFAFAFEYDLAAEVHGRKHALLEKYDVLFLQAKVRVLGKELFSGLHRSSARHDVPKKARSDHFLEVVLLCV